MESELYPEILPCPSEEACELINNFLENPPIDQLSPTQLMKGIIERSKRMSIIEKQIEEETMEFVFRIEKLKIELEELRDLNNEDISKIK